MVILRPAQGFLRLKILEPMVFYDLYFMLFQGLFHFKCFKTFKFHYYQISLLSKIRKNTTADVAAVSVRRTHYCLHISFVWRTKRQRIIVILNRDVIMIPKFLVSNLQRDPNVKSEIFRKYFE